MRGHYTTHGPSKRQMLALHGEQSGAELDGRAVKFQPVLDALNEAGDDALLDALSLSRTGAFVESALGEAEPIID